MLFSASPWLLPPLLAAGLALAYALYFRPPAASPPVRWTLALLTAAAWALLAMLIVHPLRAASRVEYHPPAVALAVDASASYAAGAAEALRAGEPLRRAAEALRRHYQDLGFRVLSLRFAETAVEGATGDGVAGDVGLLTGTAALRRQLDSLAVPNLQAIFLFSDGRFNLEEESAPFWPAPVYPVSLRGFGGAEAQAERVELDMTGESPEVWLDWRATGTGTAGGSLELQARGRTLWRAAVARPAEPGRRTRQRFLLPAAAAREAAAAPDLRALFRAEPGSGNIPQNDTVAVRRVGARAARHLFARPLRSLEDRGFLDALHAAESLGVSVLPPDSLETGLHAGDVLWVGSASPGRTRALQAAARAAIPAVVYGVGGSGAFTGEARVAFAPETEGHWPAEALRLADLGADRLALKTDTADLRPLAWVEQDGRRGILLGRRRGGEGLVFEAASLPLWSAAFRPAPDDRTVSLQRRWVQGVAELVRRRARRATVDLPLAVAGRPFHLSLRLADPPAGARARLESGGRLLAEDTARAEMRLGPLALPAGRHALTLALGGAPVWSDSLAVRAPLDLELSRLGVDEEELTSLAGATRGALQLYALTGAGEGFSTGLPDLPRGQLRQEESRSSPLLPAPVTATLAAFLFCVAWALRKIFRLD